MTRKAVPVLSLEQGGLSREDNAPIDAGGRAEAAHQVMAHAPVVLYGGTLDGRRLSFVSPNLERLAGLCAEDMVRQAGAFLERLHPQDLPGYLEALGSLAVAQSAQVTYRLRGEAGDYRRFRDELRLAGAEGTQFVGCLTALPDDPTRRDDGEPAIDGDELESAWRLLEEAIESFPDGMVMYDASERLVLCNSAFAKRHGIPAAELVGRRVEEIAHSSMRGVLSMNGRSFEDISSAVHWFMERYRSGSREAIEVACEDGRWLLVSCYPTSDGGTVLTRTDITRLKRTEACLYPSTHDIRRVVEGHPLPIWMVDLEELRVVCESPAMTRLCGRSDAPKEEERSYDFYANPQDCDRLRAVLQKNGQVNDFEFLMRRADQRLIWVSATSRLIQLEGRTIAITAFVDLTERKQREEALREAHDTLDDAIVSLSDGFALFDASGQLVKCNQGFATWYGETPQNMIGRSATDVCRACLSTVRSINGRPMDDHDSWLEWLLNRMRGNRSDAFEIEYENGRWLQISYRRTRRGGCVVSRTDITRLKAMDRALRESEERFRSITEAHPIAVIISRPLTGTILYASPAAARLWGRPQQEVVGSNVIDYYADPTERTRARREFERRGRLDAFETVYRRGDGSLVPAALNSRPIVYEGYEDAVVTSIFDLTDLKAAQREITLQREALHQSEKLNALGTLLAGVAHELNNPLSVVVGQALLLRETASDPKIAKRAEKIGKAADRCARIVRTFLAMARRQEPQRDRACLNEIVETALEITGYALRSAKIEISQHKTTDLPPVLADADQLNQVLTNLILNAQQAMAERPTPRRLEITTSYSAVDNRVVLSVADNGPGIAPELRGRIFEPFFTTKQEGMGTGVGLSVSRGIIESHGGSITAHNGPNGGAVFTIALPATNIVPDDYCEAGKIRKGKRARRVLVVDDEYEVTQTLGDILAAQGHSFVIAYSGNEALRRLAQERFDVIVSDLHMPCLDGPGFYERLRAIDPQMARRIVFITGDTLSPEIGDFLAGAGLPCIEKPFTPDDIRKVIEDVEQYAGNTKLERQDLGSVPAA